MFPDLFKNRRAKQIILLNLLLFALYANLHKEPINGRMSDFYSFGIRIRLLWLSINLEIGTWDTPKIY